MIDKVIPVQEVYKQYQKYRGFAHKVLNAYTNAPDIHEDLDSYLYETFNRILQLHDGGIKSFHSYVVTAIKRKVSRFIDSYHKRFANEVPTEFIPDTIDEKANILDTDINTWMLKRLLNKYLRNFSERDQLIIKMYFGLCPYKQRNLQEIADKFNITQSRVHAIKERILKRLYNLLKEQNLDKEGFLNE